jgi:hypothetical protein
LFIAQGFLGTNVSIYHPISPFSYLDARCGWFHGNSGRAQISKRVNQKIGKGCRFPVLGIHAQTPETIAQEQPLLINPTSNLPEDRPNKHLAINSDGSLQGLTDQGKMCIQVFGLNIRDQLVAQRKIAYRESLRLQAELKSESKEERDKAIQEIIAIKKGKEPYSIAQTEAVKALKAFSKS